MSAKIRELKLDDIKTVAGGAIAYSTSTMTYSSTSSLLLKSGSTSTTYQAPVLRAY